MRIGSLVKKGEIIGRVGTDGRTTEDNHEATERSSEAITSPDKGTRPPGRQMMDEWWNNSKEMCTHIPCGKLMYKANKALHQCKV